MGTTNGEQGGMNFVLRPHDETHIECLWNLTAQPDLAQTKFKTFQINHQWKTEHGVSLQCFWFPCTDSSLRSKKIAKPVSL